MAKYNINNYLFTKACCLGDGSLTLKTNRKKTAQFSCTHSIKQEEYIKYKASRISKEIKRKINVNGPKETFDKRTKTTYMAFQFTLTFTELTLDF